MKNSQSISDFVASTMDATLKSEAHNTLFGTRYKTASDELLASDHEDKESCDSSMADDNDAKKKKAKEEEEESSSSDSDSSSADDFGFGDDTFKEKFPEAYEYLQSQKKPSVDQFDLEERFPQTASLLDETLAFDVAIDSLLTASAALDNIGMEKTASLSLKLASLVVEAKKKDAGKDKDKEKAAKEKAAKEKEKAKEKAAKDSQSAKDKAAKDKEKEKAAKEKEKAAKEKEKAKAKADKEKADKAKSKK